ncbi:MAG: Uma2 family endonuclease [Acidobacteriota bacterium]
MTTQTASYLDAIKHLPEGDTLMLDDVSWEEYEQLLEELGDDYAVNIFYNRGRLKIMSPLLGHEVYKEVLSRIAHIVAEHIDIDLEICGSITFKRKRKEQGAEPDTCFYIQNASRIIGKLRVDLATDPPPDVVVEIDVSHDSTDKFDFYASIGVPEIWRYDEQRAQIFHLLDETFVEMPASRALPLLTAEVLTRFLDQSKTAGQTATLKSFRQWLQSQP